MKAKSKVDKNFKKFVDGIFKSTHGYYKTCETCGGTGSVLRYSYYATVMPPKAEVPCEDCRGMRTVQENLQKIRKY